MPVEATTLPPIAVGVLSYNRCDEVIRTLDVLLASEYPSALLHAVVVDNASSDGTVDAVRQRFGDRVEQIALKENRGAVARNHVLLERDEPYVFMFDDDCAPATPDTLRRAVAYLEERPEIGAVCFTVVNQHTGHPEFGDMARSARRRVPGGLEGPFVVGAAMGFRRVAIRRTGGYDERLFWGGEEYALALDLLYHDVSTVLLDNLVAYHRQAPRALTRTRVRRIDTRNNIWIAARYFPLPIGFVVALMQTARRLLATLVARDPRALAAVLAGAGEGVAGVPRMLRNRRPVPVSTLRKNVRWFFRSLGPN